MRETVLCLIEKEPEAPYLELSLILKGDAPAPTGISFFYIIYLILSHPSAHHKSLALRIGWEGELPRYPTFYIGHIGQGAVLCLGYLFTKQSPKPIIFRELNF